jgi:crotonobetainyl-CoA:carnitine CoA-transferase CaiB-like acyl-CoA transferase
MTDQPPILAGIRLLELARVPPAELPGMMLADMGADVIKIDAPRRLTDEERRRAVFAPLNRNKRSIALDLKSRDGQAIFAQLAGTADVIVEGFRPGVTTRLGADFDTVRSINPRIVYCSLSGFGQTGPYRDLPAHDLNYLAFAGILGLIGERGRAPQVPLNLVADYGGAALHAAIGILLALFARERTGQGQFVDVSYLDTSMALLGAAPPMQFFWSDRAAPARGAGFLSGTFPYYAVYATSDDRFLTVACYEQAFWDRFCEAIQRPDLACFGFAPEHAVRGPTAEESRAHEEVAAIIRTNTRDAWWRALTRAGACVAPVYDVQESLADPHVRARGLVVEAEHAEYGPVRQIGSPLRFSAAQPVAPRPAPAPGENTVEVLRELGMTPDDLTSD